MPKTQEAPMRYRSIRPALLIAVALATLLVPPRTARGQWELWLGQWMVEVFGECGIASCTIGPNLCAVISGGGGMSYCYER
jgi:hypothetical protein